MSTRYTADDPSNISEGPVKLKVGLSSGTWKTRTHLMLTLTTLKYFCINNGEQRFFSICNYNKRLS